MSKPATSFTFSYLPLTIRLRCEKSGYLPLFLGSTLRGALGWTLSKSKSDIYRYLYESNALDSVKAHIVKPYIIEPPKPKSYYRKGEEMIFSLLLLGDANLYGPELARILIEQNIFGLGARRIPFKLLSITHGKTLKTIWDVEAEKLTIASMLPVPIYPEKQDGKWASIQMQTPLRIRRQGNLVVNPDFPTIIRNITTRMRELTEYYGGSVDYEEIESICELSKTIHLVSSDIYYKRVDRFSSKINEKMDFTGIMGILSFEGNLDVFIPWLNLAQLLHIGRNTTFGCGKINVVII